MEIVRISGRDEPKQSLQVRLGVAQRGSPRRSMIRLGELGSSENLTSGSPRRRCLRLGEALRLGVDSYAQA